MTQAPTVAYDDSTPRIARIVLDRPETRNAQDSRLLYVHGALIDPSFMERTFGTVRT